MTFGSMNTSSSSLQLLRNDARPTVNANTLFGEWDYDSLFEEGLLRWTQGNLVDALALFQCGVQNDNLLCILGARYILRESPNLLATPQEKNVDDVLLQKARDCSPKQKSRSIASLELLVATSDGPARATALFLLGVVADRLHGSSSVAIAYYRQAILEGSVAATFNLGLLLVKDQEQMSLGIQLIEKAMEKRYPYAINNGAALYSAAGESCAINLYTIAAGYGDVESMVALAKLVESNNDIDLAHHFFLAAAHRGHKEAQFKLACISETEFDFEAARNYYKLSASQGHQEATSRLRLLETQQHVC